MGQTNPEATVEAMSDVNHPTKFKVFIQGDTEPLSAVGERVEQFVAATPCAPKSIGIEFLESKGVNIITLGYDPNGTPTQINLDFREVGNVLHAMEPGDGLSDKIDIAGIEFQMAQFSAKFTTALCHEVSVRENGMMTMLVMSVKPHVVMDGLTAE
jgi:hypothetical protein